MLDITDFIAERGGDPERIRESQRRRGESVEIVDEIIQMFEDHRRTNYGATQIGSKINDTQKEIGKKKKAKEDAEDLLKQKEALQKEKAAQEALAAEKLQTLHLKAKTVGNYVHVSVPISNDEVNLARELFGGKADPCRQTTRWKRNGRLRGFRNKEQIACHITRSCTAWMAMTQTEA